MKKEKENYSRLKELLKASENEYMDEESLDFIENIKKEMQKENPDLLAMQKESSKRGLSKIKLNRRERRMFKSINRHKK